MRRNHVLASFLVLIPVVTGFSNGLVPSDKSCRSPQRQCSAAVPALSASSESKVENTAPETNRKEDGNQKNDGDDDQLTEKQLEFVLGYLNKHHKDLLTEFARAFSSVGVEMAKQNAWSGGSYVIEDAEITDVNRDELQLQVTIQKRGEAKPQIETVSFSVNADPVAERARNYVAKPQVPTWKGTSAIDDIVRRLCRLCWVVKQQKVTGKLIQLAIQLGDKEIGKLPENMYLNQVPHNRFVRRYFYDGAAEATLEACILCSQGLISNRMKIVSMFPEMNPSMDSYRYVSGLHSFSLCERGGLFVLPCGKHYQLTTKYLFDCTASFFNYHHDIF